MPRPLPQVDFQLLFEKAPQLYLVLTPDLIIAAVSDNYLLATMTERHKIVGRHIFDVFPLNPDDPAATGIKNLSASLESVIKNHLPHTMAVQKYDIRQEGKEGGAFEVRYWSPVNSPVLSEDGSLLYIIHKVEDITDFVLLKQQKLEENQVNSALQEHAEKMEQEVYLRAQEIQEQTKTLELLNDELKQARDKALETSRIKSEFLANMSHEIRTPMNGILGMTEIIMRETLPTSLKEKVSIIRDAGHSLLSIINDILDFSKIEAGKLSLEPVEYEPVRLVESVGKLLAEQAKSRSLSLVTFIDPKIPSKLIGDQIRLRQILMNLVGNAVKFSEKGEVLIRATLESSAKNTITLRFSVQDEGIGLSADEIGRLFQPFEQIDGSMSRKYGGTGLGLSISKYLVELMDGKIGVKSTKGLGSCFWFTVNQECCQTIQTLPSLHHKLKNLKILVVDDEILARRVLHDYISYWGMQSTQVEDGQAALKLLHHAHENADPFDLVLIDMFMPGYSGANLAMAIKTSELLKSTRLILTTGLDSPGVGKEALEMGFDAYLVKPVRQSQLLNCITTLMLDDARNHRAVLSVADQKEAAPLPRNTTAARAELILVAEDHPINQKVIIHFLSDLGFEAHIAENGSAVLNNLNCAPYSLLLMDVQMPEMNGLEATHAIRKRETRTGEHIPIIAMTAHAIEGSKESCLAAGMDDYLCKPIDPLELKAILDKWLPNEKTQGVPVDSKSPTVVQTCNYPLDLESLIKRYGEENTGEFIRIFLDGTPDQITTIRQSAESQDEEKLVETAHALKGVCATMYAQDMRNTCSELEQTPKSDFHRTLKLVEQLEKQFEAVKSYILQRPEICKPPES
ncbi:MAG: response regulator [Candidatus Melainabacteria bacterium]|nr:response regulator [Candidatus Melainabacteria bacterium]